MSASAAGRTMKRGASLATLQASVKTGPNDLPGFSGVGMLLEIVQAPIQLCLLSIGEGDVGRFRDAVPDILGQLDPLGDRQLAEVEFYVPHAGSVSLQGCARKRYRCTANAEDRPRPEAAG